MCNHKCVALRVHGIEIYNKRKPLIEEQGVAPGAEKADGDIEEQGVAPEQKKPTERRRREGMHSRSVIYRAACLRGLYHVAATTFSLRSLPLRFCLL